MAHTHDRPVVGPRLPHGYTIHPAHSFRGERWFATCGDWQAPVRCSVQQASTDAWNHFYTIAPYNTSQTKPRLRITEFGVRDEATGLCVSHATIMRAGSYGRAYREQANVMLATCEDCNHLPMKSLLMKVARRMGEVADRLEGIT